MLRINALTLTFVFISTFMKAQDSLDDETRALITRGMPGADDEICSAAV
jgi:hypothetical protein